jgi:hypothetical protein
MKPLAIIAAGLLSGCVTIPIPPGGDKAGQLGRIVIRYEPNYLGTMSYLMNRPLPKPTSSK